MKTQKPYYITTEKISVGYDGKPLIEEVEIALRKGEILTLLGPNGAGKSTILKSIARQLSLIAGTVRLDGEDMKSLTGAELSKKMAVVMTKRLRGELMTCEDVVATGRYPYTGRFGVLKIMQRCKTPWNWCRWQRLGILCLTGSVTDRDSG